MLQKIEQYQLLTGKDNADFNERVTELLQQGFELYGSPAVSFDGEQTVVAQALVKTTKQLV